MLFHCRKSQEFVFVYVPQISYNIIGNGAVPPEVQGTKLEAVHLPQIIPKLQVCGAVKLVLHTPSCPANTLLQHTLIGFSYYIPHVCLHESVCVCLYLLYTFNVALYTQSCTHCDL
jgi:hypothetical protein